MNGDSLLSIHPSDLKTVRALSDVTPAVALVLGSGLAGVVEAMEVSARLPYDELRSYPRPRSSVGGHAGELVLGTVDGVPVVAFLGRLHLYQGVSALDAAWPARFSAALGAKTLVVTNASGAVDPSLEPGTITLIKDHLNLTGHNPLVGWSGPAGGTPFVAMGDAYDADLRAVALAEAQRLGLALPEVVYAGLLGPSYETPAEVEYLRRIGAQVVGMSTVPEVIAARALGMRVLGLSAVTNAAGGTDLAHDEVLRAGDRVADDFRRLAIAILGRL